MKFLSRQEELLLLTISKLGDGAYGVPIREHVSKTTGKYWSIGAVYDILDRLTRKGLVSAFAGSPEKTRGGKSKRYYRLTRRGILALEDVRILGKKAWAGFHSPAMESD